MDRIHPTWIEVDLSAIAANVLSARRTCKAQVMAVVKANAYGHGAVPVAHAAVRAGATWIGVARPEEALHLRASGITSPILLLGYCPSSSMRDLVWGRVSFPVWAREHIDAATQAGAAVGLAARVHLKIDTGMKRLGTPPENAHTLAQLIAGSPALVLEGIFTQFACADEENLDPTSRQLHQFEETLATLRAAGYNPRWIHAANSAGSLCVPESRFDLVRMGIAMYGLRPSAGFVLPGEYRPAMSWKAQLSHVKTVPPGSGVGYGYRYRTARAERIGTVPVGYGDGFRRTDGNQVLVGGKRVPVVGRICMDQLMVQLDTVPYARMGDEVVLIGAQGEERISVEEIASRWGTVTYEVTAGISCRVPRMYMASSDLGHSEEATPSLVN